MLTIRILSFIILFSQLIYAEGINFFSGSLNEVTAKASAENKLIFVDVYADWCAPCKWMAKNVFTNDSVGNYFNSNFVNWAIDAEKGEGPDFAKKYDVRYYPTFLFIDGNGNLVHKIIGSMQTQDFIAAAKTAADPEANMNALRTKYISGVRDKDFLRSYIKTLGSSYENSDQVINEYFSLLTEDEIPTAEHYELISNMTSPSNDLFRYFVKNKVKFRGFNGTTDPDQIIYGTYLSYVRSNARKMNESELKSMLAEINDPLLASELNILFYQGNRNWNKFFENVDHYVKNLIPKDEKVIASMKLNTYAWTIFEDVEDMSMLKKAKDWAKRSVEMDESYYNLDTYAAILYKTGDKKKSLKYYKKAVEKGKRFGDNTEAQENMIKRIEKELK